MEVHLICHSTVIVTEGERALLFDYSEKMCGKDVRELTQRAIEGKRTIALFSHTHSDHFDPDVAGIGGVELYVLPPDCPSRYVDRLRPSIKLEHTEERLLPGGLRVKTYPSTDEGVAYLLEGSRGGRIFFAGDLALWTWPGDDEENVERVREMWRDTLKEVSKERVDVAFLVADPRLPHLGGFREAVASIRPRYAFPIHSFGKLEYLTGVQGEGVMVPKQFGESFSLSIHF